MAKHRILQEGESHFYPQEKPSIFHPWIYIDNRFPHKYVWEKRSREQSLCSTLERAQEIVSRRKHFLKEQGKYPIIHKIE